MNQLVTPSSSTGLLHAPSVSYLSLWPMAVMFLGALLLLAIAALVRGPVRRQFATAGTVVVGLGSLIASFVQWHQVSTKGAWSTLTGSITTDGFAVMVNIIVSASMIIAALIADGYLAREKIEGAEFHVLALCSATGAMVMGSANDLIVVFLGLEILSIALYVLAAFNPRRAASGEAAMKYFILGGFASAIFVYGIAMTYGATGTTNISQIASYLAKVSLLHNGLVLAALAMLIVGFAFKVAAVPFHLWTPDVYQGAPTPVTGFMAAVAKVGAFAAMLRVLLSAFGSTADSWRPIIYVLAIASLIVGSVGMVVQRDVKRMLAYSSISHAGYILLGVQAATARGVSASLFYLAAYAFLALGSFGVITVLAGGPDADHDLGRFRGLLSRQPLLAVAFVILLLAQAGTPFTTGFLAKLGVITAAVSAASTPLALVAMLCAVIGGFAYLRVAITATAPEGTDLSLLGVDISMTPGSQVKVPVTSAVAIGLCVLVTVLFGLWPAPLTQLAHQASLLFIA